MNMSHLNHQILRICGKSIKLKLAVSSEQFYLKLKDELVKYGGLSKSLRPRQLLTSFMLGRVPLDLSMMPL